MINGADEDRFFRAVRIPADLNYTCYRTAVLTVGREHISFTLFLVGIFTFLVCVRPVNGQFSTVQKNTRIEQAAALVAEGASALEQNDLTTAQSFFERALAANPGNAAAHTYLGIIEDRRGDLVSAEHHFAAAALADPLSPSAHNNHGACLLKLGRAEEAAAEFVRSLDLDKNQSSALVNLAQIRVANPSPASLREARELFQRAYAIAPAVDIARALVVVALRLGDQRAAADYYRQYSADLMAGNAQTTETTARAELGAALLEAGLASEAAVELKAALVADPSNTDTVVRLAKAYVALNDLPGAGRTLELAAARGLDAAPIYALLASVYEKSGHIENAIPAMRLAIQRDPQSETYRFSYGMLLISVLAPDAAVIRLNEALELFPKSARLWLALGIAHFKAGRNDEAAKAIRRSIELDSKYAPASAYLGMTYVEIGQYDLALGAYKNALTVNDKLGIVDFLIADLMLKQSTVDDAAVEAHLQRAVKLESHFAPAQLALGKLYLRTNRLTDAATELENVIKLDPNLAEAYYQLGLTYTRLKRTADARASLEKFKQLNESQKEQALKDRKDIIKRLANVLF